MIRILKQKRTKLTPFELFRMQREKSGSEDEFEQDPEIAKTSFTNSTATSSGTTSTRSPSCSPPENKRLRLNNDTEEPIERIIDEDFPSDLLDKKKNEPVAVEITQIPILNTEPTTTSLPLVVLEHQQERPNKDQVEVEEEVEVEKEEKEQDNDDSSATSSLSSNSDMESDESLGSYTGISMKYHDGGDAMNDVDAKSSAITSARFDVTFLHYYEQLKAFKEKFGHTKVTPKYDKKLAGYCADIRNAKRHPDANYGRNFKDKHFKAFDELGFVWNPKKEGDEKSFDYRIQQLKAFKEKYGHLRPTKKHDTNLAHFVANIRKARRNPERAIRVTDDRIKALDAIGFEWEPKPTQGDMNFWSHIEKLRAFKREHGHSLVTHKHDKKLAVFCNNMRVAKRGSVTTRRLTPERIKALDDLDFIWEPGLGKTAADFIDLVSQLKTFKKTFGHYSVTAEHDRKLADFCTKMRIAYKSPGTGLASADRIKVLDDMGFEWEPKHSNFFDVCFDKLKAVKEAGGDILEAEKSNSDLAKFCKCMRHARRHLEAEEGVTSTELSDRIKELDAIGFKWDRE